MPAAAYRPHPYHFALNKVWSVSLLDWVDMTQPISGASVTVNQGTGGASAWLVTGPLTDAQLRASAVTVSDSRYTQTLDYDVSNNPIYIGIAAFGSSKASAVWQIRKLTFDVSNNVVDIQYANGTDAFTAIWNNRASLSYS